MKCPKCKTKLKVQYTIVGPENEVMRRRKCPECGHAIFTEEREVEPTAMFKSKYYKAQDDMKNRRKIRTHNVEVAVAEIEDVLRNSDEDDVEWLITYEPQDGSYTIEIREKEN